jgi:hypothetical protein
MLGDVGAAGVASGVIARLRGAGDAAWDARLCRLDADLSFTGLADRGWDEFGRGRP